MLTAVYDLASSPPTFDFAGFLVSAERERLRLGKKHVRILIAAGPDNGFRKDRLPPRDPAERRRMLNNIVIPMCSLLPSCVSVEEWEADCIRDADFPVGWNQRSRKSHYGTDKFVQAWKDNCFPLTAGVTEKKDFITITLREADYWPTRNSNVDVWMKLAQSLINAGEAVTIIRDADLPNSSDRAGVYERAKLNLFIGSGTMAMTTLIREARCLVFKMCSPSAPCVDPQFFAAVGMPVGSQIGRDNHRIVWKDDDYETLVEETVKEIRINSFKVAA